MVKHFHTLYDEVVLYLIKRWPVMSAEEEDGRGGKQRTIRNKDAGKEMPQGAPISLLRQ